MPGQSPKTGKESGAFNYWDSEQDQSELDEMIRELDLMIANDKNKWILPYLIKQSEAFAILRATPIQK